MQNKFSSNHVYSQLICAMQHRTLTPLLIEKLSREGLDFSQVIPAGTYYDTKNLFQYGLPVPQAPGSLAFCNPPTDPHLYDPAPLVRALSQVGADLSAVSFSLLSAHTPYSAPLTLDQQYKIIDALTIVHEKIGFDHLTIAHPAGLINPLILCIKNQWPLILDYFIEAQAPLFQSLPTHQDLPVIPIKQLIAEALFDSHRWELWSPTLFNLIQLKQLRLNRPLDQKRKRLTFLTYLTQCNCIGDLPEKSRIHSLELLAAAIACANSVQCQSARSHIQHKTVWNPTFCQAAEALLEARLLDLQSCHSHAPILPKTHRL